MTLEELLAREGVDGEAVVRWARERVQSILATLPPESELADLLAGVAAVGQQMEEHVTSDSNHPLENAADAEAASGEAMDQPPKVAAASELAEVADSEEIEVLDAEDVELLDVDLLDDEVTVADARRALKDNHG